MQTIKTEIHVWFDLDNPEDYAVGTEDTIADRWAEDVGTTVGHRMVMQVDVEIPPAPVYKFKAPAQ